MQRQSTGTNNFDAEGSRRRVEETLWIYMMISSFADVGLSLNVDGSEDHRIKFQGQEPGKPQDFDY